MILYEYGLEPNLSQYVTNIYNIYWRRMIAILASLITTCELNIYNIAHYCGLVGDEDKIRKISASSFKGMQVHYF